MRRPILGQDLIMTCHSAHLSEHTLSIFYRPQRSCEGYVFTGVCLSTWGEGEYPSMPCRWYPSRSCSRSRGVRAWGGGRGGDPPASRRLLLRTVRILLECISCLINFYVKQMDQFITVKFRMVRDCRRRAKAISLCKGYSLFHTHGKDNL